MNSKKYFILITTLMTFLFGLNTNLCGKQQKDPNSEIKALQEKIKQLEIFVESQQKLIDELQTKLDELIKENEKLKTMHKEVIAINGISQKTSFDPNNIVYRGKKKSPLWFKKMYDLFSGKIVFIEGKYYKNNSFENSVGEILKEANTYKKNHVVKLWNPQNNQYGGGTWLNIEQVLGDNEAIVVVKETIYSRTDFDGIKEINYKTPIYITDLEGPLVDGQKISLDYLVSLGTYEYKSVLGSKNTIPSFKAIIFHPLTREQFAEALNSGIDIGEYEVVLKDYKTLRTLSENQYSFLENKDDGSVTIKRGDRIIKRLDKGEYRFEIVPKSNSK